MEIITKKRADFRLNHAGFSLIEVIVALVILAALSMLTAQAMRSGIQSRADVSGLLAREAALADALRIMKADIGSAFHHRDIQGILDAAAAAGPTPTPGPGGVVPPPAAPTPPPPASGTPRPTPPIVTGFIGDTESMYFTTLSNVRVIRDVKESDQGKVGFFVKSCQPRLSSNGIRKSSGASKCLYRSFSPVLNEEIDKPGPEMVLAENVQEFKLRYLGPKHEEEYTESWKTGPKGDPDKRDLFPYAVEITLALHDKSDPKDKLASNSVLVPLHFPNNPKKERSSSQSSQGR